MLLGLLVKRLSWFVTGSIQVLMDLGNPKAFTCLFVFTIVYFKNILVSYGQIRRALWHCDSRNYSVSLI